MKEKILIALKTKYTNLGLSAETLEGVANQLAAFVKEDAGVDAAVAGAESMLKSIQSFADSRAANSKTEAERLKAEIAAAKQKLEEYEKQKPVEKPTDEVPPYIKAMLDRMETLEASITNFNAERQSQSLTDKLTGLLSEKKVPESYFKIATAGRQFKDETEVQALADLVVKQYEVFKQDSANTGFSFTAPPENGMQPKSDSDDLAKLIYDGTKEIVEQIKK